jgi:chloride channel protein, CIC family
MNPDHPASSESVLKIPATLLQRGAVRFWIAVVVIGIGTGLAAAGLTKFLEFLQHVVWAGSGLHIVAAAEAASAWRHILVLLGAGVAVGIGQFVLVRLTSGNAIDITAAIWFSAGRLPALRTLGSAVLSVIAVAMGASLGREGAPKQAGAVFADLMSDRQRLSDEQRKLLVACGAGAGMAAAYGVPLGGALFAIEVLRGVLALRLILPALLMSLIATAISWIFLPDAPTYRIPSFTGSWGVYGLAIAIGPLAGVVSVWFVRAVAWAEHSKPKGWGRFVLPVVVMGALGAVSLEFPELLGNGSDLCQMLFVGGVTWPVILFPLLVLKPCATVMCIRSGTPGGLFTPSLSLGALLGASAGWIVSLFWPGTSLALCAILGAGAVVAATTQGPLSAAVLVMELTGRDRSFIAPLLLAIALATLVSRTIEPRSIYDARLTDEEIKQRLAAREPSPH